MEFENLSKPQFYSVSDLINFMMPLKWLCKWNLGLKLSLVRSLTASFLPRETTLGVVSSVQGEQLVTVRPSFCISGRAMREFFMDASAYSDEFLLSEIRGRFGATATLPSPPLLAGDIIHAGFFLAQPKEMGLCDILVLARKWINKYVDVCEADKDTFTVDRFLEVIGETGDGLYNLALGRAVKRFEEEFGKDGEMLRLQQCAILNQASLDDEALGERNDGLDSLRRG